ncbi:DUF371 domain-containing protein [Candidatus Undinarchaeota archaeon]
MKEKIICWGHENVRSSHKTTLEITKEKELSLSGDCIIGVNADKGLLELSDEFRNRLKEDGSILKIMIIVDDLEEAITAKGSSELELSHAEEMVVRKSDFISDRTLAIDADKASADLTNEFKEKLRNPNQKIEVILELD